MAQVEALLGFDARKTWLDPASHWSSARRSRFLLRAEVSPVLSVDDLVWPSVFRTHNLPLASDEELDALGLAGPTRPHWTGPNLPLWEDLDALRAHLGQSRHRLRQSYRLIAVTCLAAADRMGSAPYGPHPLPTTPGTRDPAWPLLGFDVADGSFVSALTNCGYRDEAEQVRAAARWAAGLNRHHLFEAPEPAAAFARGADRRVPEHAPFFVYGLYVVENSDTTLAST